MDPIQFKEANTVLAPPMENGKVKIYKSRNVREVTELHIWTNGEQCISCWHMSWRERLSALLYGKVWVAMLSGKTQPPLFAKVANEIFEAEQKQ